MDQPIRNAAGERLDYSFHPGAANARHVVVIGHGVTGHKDRPFLVALAEGLAAAGIPALRHSWSGNAGSEGAFAESNITKEVADLGSIIDALATQGYTMAYAGHSMGGAVGVRRAASDDRVRLLVSLAGIIHAREFAEATFGDLVPGESLMFDKPGLVLPAAYMADLRSIDTLVDDAARVKVPWLLVHGTADPLVPIHHSRDAFNRATAPKQFVELPGADHIFEPGMTGLMVRTVVDWFSARFAELPA